MQALADFVSTIGFTPESFKGLIGHIDQDWIAAALRATRNGKAHLRRRKLPREAALWLPIGMGLFRDRSIHEVVEHLSLVVESEEEEGISAGAIPRARSRVGSEPLKSLFELSAEGWSDLECEDNRWRGLTLWAMDGTCLKVADTPGNDEFGRPGNGSTPGPFPQTRVVALLNARTRMLAGLNMGPLRTGELTLLEPLWDLIPDHSMTLVDRGLLSWWEFRRLNLRGQERHWLTRERNNLDFTPIKKLGRGDDLVEVRMSAKTMKKHPDAPRTMVVRRVRVVRKGFKPTCMLTSALDSEKYPASELRDVYVNRWEIELAYDELKNHLLEGERLLRSKTPEGVRQEVYGIAIAYNLVRLELARLANEVGVDPRRMSFQHGLHLIRNFMLASWATSPGAIPKRLESLERHLRLLVLPPRRPRSYPRHVRTWGNRYPQAPRRPRPSTRRRANPTSAVRGGLALI